MNILILKELFLLPGCLKTRADLPSSVCSFSCRQTYMEKRFSSLIHDVTRCPARKSHLRWRSKSRLPATHGQHLLLESSTAQQVISANLTPLGNKWPFFCMGCQNRGKKVFALLCHISTLATDLAASAQSHCRHKMDSMQPPGFWPWYTLRS